VDFKSVEHLTFKKNLVLGNLNHSLTYFPKVKHILFLLFLGLANLTVGQDFRAAAIQQYTEGNYDVALHSINQLEKFEACDYFIKANALQKLGQFQQASLNYNEAKSNGCKEELLLLNNGICEYNLGNLSESVHLLKLFVHEHNTNFQGHYWLASAYYLQHKYSKSRESLEHVFSLNETYAPAYFLDAAIHQSRKQYASAADAFLEAYAYDSTLEEARLQAGISMLDMQKYEEALSIFKQMLTPANMSYVQALYYAGETSYLLKENDEACKYWKSAAEAGDYDSKEIVRTWCENKKTPIFKIRSSRLKF
jgi:predicted Zn-dependent protease